jgi:hypothetical protein
MCNRFNINQLRATKFHSVQQGIESGSGPGALPGAPRGSPLDSAVENLRVLKAVDYARLSQLQIRLQ